MLGRRLPVARRRRRWHRARPGMTRDPRLTRQIRLLRGYAALTYPFACVPFLFFFFVYVVL